MVVTILFVIAVAITIACFLFSVLFFRKEDYFSFILFFILGSYWFWIVFVNFFQ